MTPGSFPCSTDSARPESEEHRHRMRKIVGANPGQIKPMTYKIVTCHFEAKCLPLFG